MSIFRVISFFAFSILFFEPFFSKNFCQAQEEKLSSPQENLGKNENKEAEEESSIEEKIIEILDKNIYKSSFDGRIGNKTAQIEIVQFFDYNCSYCKKAFEIIKKITDSDNSVQFILKELPVLGEESKKIHTVSAAVQQIAPEKYSDVHALFMKNYGLMNQEKAISLAVQKGIDEKELRKKINDPKIANGLKNSIKLAEYLEIRGTPSYIIAKEVVQGMISEESFREKIQKLKIDLKQ